MMLKRYLKDLIRDGRLTVILASGRSFSIGTPLPDAPRLDVTIRFTEWLSPLKLALNPELELGEAYMEGRLIVERGTIWDLLDLSGLNLARLEGRRKSIVLRLRQAIARYLHQHNSRTSSSRNVAHHYDLSNLLYRQFLDEDMQYSCAYFETPSTSLEDAQKAKKRHIAAKLKIAPGQHVLDIGCGWGGMALSLAQLTNAAVTGVTLSREQLAVARQRVRDADLDHKISFELRDYRDLSGHFDRIVSVGMFEHVGTPNYQAFFDTVARLLTEDGVALIHSIGRMDGPGVTNPWVRKYIFPGGYIPALSEVLPAIERSGLLVTDIEILRLHYAETLRHWRERFLARREQIREIYDERFCRMWEFYLAASEMSFRHQGMMVFQIQLTRRIDALPITRDYMLEGERALEEGAFNIGATVQPREKADLAQAGE